MSTVDSYQKKAISYRNRNVKESLEDSLTNIIIETSDVIKLLKKDDYNKELLKDELGDVLWHLANIADIADIKLSDVVNTNLDKLVNLNYIQKNINYNDCDKPFDNMYTFVFKEFTEGGIKYVNLYLEEIDGSLKQLGDTLSDNSITENHYRYHDILHLSLMVYLNWSPITRDLLDIKRVNIKEFQDRGRAQIIEEAIIYMFFDHINNHKTISTSLIKQIMNIVSNLEVSKVNYATWKYALNSAYSNFNKLINIKGYKKVIIFNNNIKIKNYDTK